MIDTDDKLPFIYSLASEVQSLIDQIRKEGKKPRNITCGAELYVKLASQLRALTVVCNPHPDVPILHPILLGLPIILDKDLHPALLTVNVHE